jgi:hypothetical protein
MNNLITAGSLAPNSRHKIRGLPYRCDLDPFGMAARRGEIKKMILAFNRLRCGSLDLWYPTRRRVDYSVFGANRISAGQEDRSRSGV